MSREIYEVIPGYLWDFLTEDELGVDSLRVARREDP